MMISGFSKVSETINQILGTQGFFIPFVIKIVFCLGALCLVFVILKNCLPKTSPPLKTPKPPQQDKEVFFYSAIAITSLISVFLSIKGYTVMEIEGIYDYKLPFSMGHWSGYNINDKQAEEYYNKKQLITRAYWKENDFVGLMAVPSNAKSRNIHTPEYCQQALGWEIKKSSTFSFKTASGREIFARRLSMTDKQGINRTFIYWFDDGVYSTGTYLKFISYNSIQRLIGNKKNWVLYLIWSDGKNGQKDIEDFLAHFKELKFEKIKT